MKTSILAICLFAFVAGADSDALRFARARGAAENGDFVTAAEHWRQLGERHPDSQLAQVGLAMVLRRGEEFEAAREVLAAAVELGEPTPELLWQRALLHNLLGENEAALADFDAIEEPPLQATYHHMRGLALQALDRNEEACAAFERAGELDPKLFATRYAHYLCLRQFDFDAAQLLLPEIESLRRELPEWMRNDQLRLEAGPLSELMWPDAYAGLKTKLGGEAVVFELHGVRNRADGRGAVIELWIGDTVLRRKVETPPTRIGVGDAKRLDIVRVEWPNGIAQNLFDVEVDALEDRTLRIDEQLFIKGSWGGIQAREKE